MFNPKVKSAKKKALHSEQESAPVGLDNTLSQRTRALFLKASQLFTSVNTQSGYYTNRESNTRTKKRPSHQSLTDFRRQNPGINCKLNLVL